MKDNTIFWIIALFMVGIAVEGGLAQPISQVFIGTEDAGVEIEYPKIDKIEQNNDYIFNFHTYNKTTGYPLDNETLTCSFHLYNISGSHLLSINHGDIPFGDDYDFEITVDKGNFSYLGDYAYIFHCNTSYEGGFASTSFKVVGERKDVRSKTITIYTAFMWVVISVIFYLALVALKELFFLFVRIVEKRRKR